MIADEHESTGTGYRRVDTKVSCMLTRFRVRSAWSLLRAYWLYRQVRKQARQVDGLIVTMFLIEDLHTYYTFSLWERPGAILEFNTRVSAHAWAANHSLRDLEVRPAGLHLWSAQFRLSAVSPNNLRWEGVDLSAILQRAAKA